MTRLLEKLVEEGHLQMLDLYFSRFIAEHSGEADPDVMAAAALVSASTRQGNVCIDLAQIAGRSVSSVMDAEIQGPGCFPDLALWRKRLGACRMVGIPGDRRPLILDHADRLYLHRYWKYESDIADSLQNRIRQDDVQFNPEDLRASIDRMFPPAGNGETDWQRAAAIVAIHSRICIISGGPGTGKTTTVGKILALLLELDPAAVKSIALTAPTGKAAARLAQSIQELIPRIPSNESILEAMPTEAMTLHRLLKAIPGTPFFRHHKEHPLDLDLLVVDEASMVDIALMAKLLDALPERTRIILLGDRDQLSSVEAGSVLGDICGRDQPRGFPKDFQSPPGETFSFDRSSGRTPAQPPLLADRIVTLEKNYRFSERGGIGALCRAIRFGDAGRAMEILGDSQHRDLCWENVSRQQQWTGMLEKILRQGYKEYFTQKDPRAVLDAIQDYMILCAVRIGPFGVDAVNHAAVSCFQREGWIPSNPWSVDNWFDHRPVLVTQNDYRSGLFNGDIGVALATGNRENRALRVMFPDSGNGLRRFSPHQLPVHETVFAMTVHKSQGSEFETVVLILPDRDYPVLTRELIYTGITRARKKLVVLASEETLRRSISRKLERTSGLRDALWQDAIRSKGDGPAESGRPQEG